MKQYILTQDFKISFSSIESLNDFLDKNTAFKDFKITEEKIKRTAYTPDNRYFSTYNIIVPPFTVCLVEKIKKGTDFLGKSHCYKFNLLICPELDLFTMYYWMFCENTTESIDKLKEIKRMQNERNLMDSNIEKLYSEILHLERII